MSLRIKLILLFQLTGVLPALVVTYISLSKTEKSFHDQNFDRLTAVRDIREKQLQELFSTMRKQIITLGNSNAVVKAMKEFKKEFHGYSQAFDVESKVPEMRASLKSYYMDQFAKEYESSNGGKAPEKIEAILNSLAPVELAFQYNYISENENPLGSKHELYAAKDGSQWSAVHKEMHPNLKEYLEEFGYYDIFLIDNETGHIVYSVFKELDFGTSLRKGPYAETNFARAFKEAADAKEKNHVALVDLERYFPSYELPAGFLAKPIFDGSKKVGVLVFQIPVEKIDAIMTNNKSWKETGFGDSAETYLVGHDLKMRSLSRFLAEAPDEYFSLIRSIGTSQEAIDYIKAKDTTIITQEVDTPGVRRAIKGETATAIFNDYRGVAVMSSFKPLDLFGLKWVLMSEIDDAEAIVAITALKKLLVAVCFGIMAAVFLYAFTVATRISAPVRKTASILTDVANGDLTASLEAKSKDEIGEMANALNQTVKSMREALQLDKVDWAEVAKQKQREKEANEKAKQLADESRQRAEELQNKVDQMLVVVEAASEGDLTKKIDVSGDDAIGKMAGGLKNFFGNLRESIEKIRDTADALNGASQHLSEVSDVMSQDAQKNSTIVEGVAKGTDEINSSMSTVAASSEEMGASISDVSRVTNKAATDSTKAVEISKNATDTIAKLGESSADIGSFIKDISSIASQTNLLALNATIESARAGDAGKGFAVVANEVKELANQTTSAAEQIKQKIDTIQSDTQKSIDAINEVANLINTINSSSGTIAAAVEEQTATTTQISQTIGSAAQMTSDINANIKDVNEAAVRTTKNTDETKQSSQSVSELSSNLQSLVSRFKTSNGSATKNDSNVTNIEEARSKDAA